MGYLTTLTLLLLLSLFTSGYAATFEIRNNCPYTVWAAATPVGGGKQLDQGQSWTIDVPGGTRMARIWGRTNCNFDASGRGSCETGDCGGALQCTAWGKPPNTLAEFTLTGDNNFDTIDISLVDGFNVPLNFAPTKPGADKCHAISCTADVNGQCPAALKVPGGCNNPCTTFGGQQYCCTEGPCGPSDYSKFFKGLCPDAYSYPQDDPSSTFGCPAGSTDYRVVFCP
ncbi:osmotin-like protein OSML81 [Ipomoea triloba]|uniref:osmotin-like protein OSML81 n=1 Tax=Ipomoea triloba TaxID=35885 RepID=UPI00125DC1AA|nr:osmotin-like protein OSML81 [Ipomoea triloba]